MNQHTPTWSLPPGFTPVTPEKPELVLGHLPLTDSASLVIAREKGFFAEHGLEVTLQREPSWANIRDKLACGILDAAHMLAPMPLETNLGIGPVRVPMMTALNLSLNGNAVTFSPILYDALLALNPAVATQPELVAPVLKQLLDAERKQGKAPPVFAHVYPYSCHHYELRYWLASAGIDPDHEVKLVVIPPSQVVENMQLGYIDGFCVGEPWNQHAQESHVGHVVISGHQIWCNAPEKVLGVTQEWASLNPLTHAALIQAIVRAAIWLDEPENRPAAAEILADGYVDLPAATLRRALLGTNAKNTAHAIMPGRPLFHRNAASFPWVSHAEWLIAQMQRWGQLDHAVNIQAEARRAYRPDIYRAAVTSLGISAPVDDRKIEGEHADSWLLQTNQKPLSMTADEFIDKRIFDPNNAENHPPSDTD